MAAVRSCLSCSVQPARSKLESKSFFHPHARNQLYAVSEASIAHFLLDHQISGIPALVDGDRVDPELQVSLAGEWV